MLEAKLKELLRITKVYGLNEESEQVGDRICDRERGLMVLVSGEGNFGKSSLINALAGKDIARVAIVPTTFKVDIYNHSSDGQEYAVVRRIGETVGTRMDLEQTQRVCDEEEEAIQQALRSQIAYRPTVTEVEWFRSGLQFGSELCLVDTPGLAQLLLNAAALPERLVKGLGATYYVEDVWEMWYHRADIVLWCFQANMLSAVETHRALSILTQRYRKTILPVVTKADLIPEDDWRKITDEFHGRYGNVFAANGAAELYFTSCKDFQRPGAHLGRLLRTLLELAPAAREGKLQATEQSVVDFSRHLERILRESAEPVVSNLQVITDTADEIALESMKLMGRATRRIQQDAEDHYETKIIGLEAELRSIYAKMAPMVMVKLSLTEQQKTELRTIAEQHLRKYLEEDRLNEKLNSALDQVGEEIFTYATVNSETKVLVKVRISSSLQVTRDRFSIGLRIRLSELKANLNLPPIELPPGCLALLAMLGAGASLGGSLLLVWLITVI